MGKPLGKKAPPRTESNLPKIWTGHSLAGPDRDILGRPPGGVLSTAEGPRPFQLGTPDRYTTACAAAPAVTSAATATAGRRAADEGATGAPAARTATAAMRADPHRDTAARRAWPAPAAAAADVVSETAKHRAAAAAATTEVGEQTSHELRANRQARHFGGGGGPRTSRCHGVSLLPTRERMTRRSPHPLLPCPRRVQRDAYCPLGDRTQKGGREPRTRHCHRRRRRPGPCCSAPWHPTHPRRHARGRRRPCATHSAKGTRRHERKAPSCGRCAERANSFCPRDEVRR